MAMTLRLPAALAQRGRRYADQLGISLNALLAVALRDYLDARTGTTHPSPPPGVHTLAQAIARQVTAGPVKRRN